MVESEARMQRFRIDGQVCTLGNAVLRARELIQLGPVAYVASGQLSVEEQAMLRKLVEKEPGSVTFVGHTKEGDGRLITNDRTPNVRGGLVTGLIKELPVAELDKLRRQLESGEIKTVVCYGEDLTKAGIPSELLKKANLVYLGTHRNATSDVARVLLPTLTVFEKTGTLINQQFRLQKFYQAVPGPAGLMPDVYILDALLAECAGGTPCRPTLEQIWQDLAAKVEILAEVKFNKIPETGLLLDGSAYAGLPFCEGPGWHFEPQRELAATSKF
jgi:NADH-quinone oxidoreductase subunit G